MNGFNGLWQHVKSYRFNSIFIKNFLILMVLLVLPLSSLGVGVYWYYYNMLKQEITAANNNSLTRVVDLIDMVMRETDKLSVRIASDPNVIDFSKNGGPGFGSFDFFQRAQEIFRTLNLSTITSDYINSIYVYSESNDFVLSSGLASDKTEKFADMGWLSSYDELKKNKLNLTLNARALKNNDSQIDGQQFISSVRTLPLIGNSIKGAVVVNINADNLSALLNKVNQLSQNILIAGINGNVYYSNEDKLINKNISEIGLLQNIKLNSDNYYGLTNDQDGEKQIVSIIRSEDNQLYYISLVPLQKFEMKLSYLKNVMLWLIIICIFMAIMIAFFFSLKVYKPIKNIISILENPEIIDIRNSFSNKLHLDELKYIAKSLIERTYQNQEMEKELGRRMLLLKKAQSIALQSQINPHFLYNTLETINWMAMSKLGHSNPISSMLTSLSQLLRLSLETEEEIIPVRTEIEHAKRYLEIQQIRYHNRFILEWDVSCDVLDEKIVKITLQPLLENAIYHGIKPKSGPGRICIRGYRQKNCMIFEVEDDGIGMKEDVVTHLNDGLGKNIGVKEDLHIGIMNVNQRLKLVFGDEYGLFVQSTLGSGTIVRFLLPLTQNEED
ncbi:MAG: histidine kinase [Paenibacillaceae bacterium]|nr:histidine kinase [Paenibacillaceae bacterium]